MEVLKQGRSTPVPVEKQVAILYAVVKGVLTDVAVEDIQAYEEGLYTFLDSDAQGVACLLYTSCSEKKFHSISSFLKNC